MYCDISINKFRSKPFWGLEQRILVWLHKRMPLKSCFEAEDELIVFEAQKLPAAPIP